MRVIRLADCPPVPWKNGAGATRELWRRDDAEGLLIRISVAEITGDQPFSNFPGIDRTILQLDGPEMILSMGGMDHRIATPLAFPGEARVTCRLSAPGTAHDFNLMVRRGTCRGGMVLLSPVEGERVELDATGGIAAFLALTPFVLAGAATFTLGPSDLLLSDEPAVLVSQTKGRGVLLTAGHPGPSGSPAS